MRYADVTVLCTQGGPYTPAHVVRLKRMLDRHAPAYDRFVCLTHEPQSAFPDDVYALPLFQGWPGWWNKIEFFRPGLFNTARAVSFDLDVLIIADLTPLFRADGPFLMHRDFVRLPNGDAAGSSTVMAWERGWRELYLDLLNEDIKAKIARYDRAPCLGDQGWVWERIGEHVGFVDDIQPGIYSYKLHCRNGLPRDAVLISFHGKPKPDDVTDEWVRRILAT